MPTYVEAENFLDAPRGAVVANKAVTEAESCDEAYNKQGSVRASFAANGATDTICQKESVGTHTQPKRVTHQEEEHKSIPFISVVMTYFTFLLLFTFGCIAELRRKLFGAKRKQREGYASLLTFLEYFWQNHFYRRARDCFNHAIDSRPSRVIGVMERVSTDSNRTFSFTGNIKPCVNLSSYNYLGFADDIPHITREVLNSLDRYGLASCSAAQHAGQHGPVSKLERAIADFLKKEDAVVCGMGFGTNFRGLPALFGEDTLVVSDSLNHSSLVNGIRLSGARAKVFKNADMNSLEKVLREAVVLGQNPKGAYVPWTRIVIVVEGVYSMEGEFVNLPRVVELKKKYGALLFVDEAHSIGATGRTGRGVTEHFGVDPRDVDILMGTFTKSFGAIGGYLAGDQSVIDHIRTHSSLALHCDTLSPPCAQQALSVLDVLNGNDGTDIGPKHIQQLMENSRFFRQGLIDRGFSVLGNDASPVVPVMLYHLGRAIAVWRKCMRRGLAIVIVGYPATPLLGCRIRFCVSAAHTRADLQFALDVMDQIKKETNIQFLPSTVPPQGEE
ncbi:serine palmitoyltransferase, putative [Trypanosoma equiperdum]|uniref:serine C-palmitoyltransferase n=2 Tax=Trypanozoon TaxID=39700 RepID=Q38BJ5_TRYB2|nr:serine palmitoyltransferase, putative [Trypanosoma brucei brucei TREU927]EAN77825.1 serine palmitoyltransferase, putative [Trypanosoma brucei brucei TREU927]SCU70979.1 serine palmitoyltransferase, putative [Trypanosoma equiperdum]